MTDLEKLQSLKVEGEEIFQRLREQPLLFTDNGDIDFARIHFNRLKYIDNEINELLVKMYNNKES
jgi:pimeloyl-CoA synthetase